MCFKRRVSFLADNQLVVLEAESSGNPVSMLLALRQSTDKYCAWIVCLSVPVLGCKRVGSQDSEREVCNLCCYACTTVVGVL